MGNVAVELSDAIAGMVEANGGSVVRVEGRHGIPASGTVWSADGIIVTTSHAVEREEGIELGLPDGSTAEAEVVGRDPATDLLTLRTAASGLAVPAWGEIEGLKVGHLVVALARPGRTARAGMGIIGALGPSWRTPMGGKLERYVEVDGSYSPGFSGGPLLDMSGRVLGIATSGLLRRHGLAIPTATVRRVVESLLAHGRVRRGYLGVSVYPVRVPEAIEAAAGQGRGALVLTVQPGSAADRAGIVQGDVLLSLDGTPVGEPGDLLAFLDEERIGTEVAARIARGGSVKDMKVTVGTRT